MTFLACSLISVLLLPTSGKDSFFNAALFNHLFPVLESDADSVSLAELAHPDLGCWGCPAIGLGRLTALQKEVGGIRGFVVGDMMRRLVARTMAQQVSKEVEEATSPSSML